MTVLVAGGHGFIGVHLVRELLRKGERVVVFDPAPTPESARDILGKVKIVRGDASNVLDVLQAVKEHEVQDVYHMVALLADVSQVKPLLASKVNVESTLNFLEAARMFQIRRVVFASSVAVYDPAAKTPVTEASPMRPGSVYGATKVMSEFYGMHYHRQFGVDFRALRFTTIYGLGKTGGSTGICSLMIEKSARGEPVEVGIADAVTDWLYIKDAVSSLLLARETENPTERVYNIGTSTHSVGEVAEMVKRAVPGASIRLQPGKGFPWPPSYDCTKAKEELGYASRFSIEEGIRDFVAEAQQRS
jgi:UDP-glucose 4-epimerase